ncbi:MAG: hypothetical protein U0694_06030 [Anaerolineae bacterium]
MIRSSLTRLKTHIASESKSRLLAEGVVMLAMLLLVVGSIAACAYTVLLVIATQDFMARF